MKVFIYARPETIDYFTELANRAYKNPEITVGCDFKDVGDIWLGESLYIENNSDNILDDNTYYDIIARCRFLRSLKKLSAIEIINKYWLNIEKIFNSEKFDVVLGQIIDNYSMDIINRIAERKNIPTISFSPTFIRGYSRFTVRGEFVNLKRKIEDEEIEEVLQNLLAPKYKARYAGMSNKNSFKAVKWYVRRLLIERLYYPLMKNVKRDKLNYHYNSILLSRGNIFDYVGPKIEKFYKNIDDIEGFENSVYMPLHAVPESTTDYWGENPRFGDYEKVVIDFLESSEKKINFIVKEHPAMYGRRYIEFYRKLTAFENVILIDPFNDSNQLLEKVENVVVSTGSVGIEALLRKKRVFNLTVNYYSNLHPNMHKVEKLNLEDLTIQLKDYEPKIFMRDLLSGLFKGNICAEREIMKSDLDLIAKNIRNYNNK